MLEQSGVNQEFIEHINSFILDLKKVGDSEILAKLIRQRGMRDMTATISDFEQQIMQKGLNEGRLEGLNEGPAGRPERRHAEGHAEGHAERHAERHAGKGA